VFQISASLDVTTCRSPNTFRAFGYHAGSAGLDPVPYPELDGGALRVLLPPYSLQVLDIELSPE
jgi:hypothetical protein